MIKEIPLNKSQHYHQYKYDTKLYTRGIKADTCIKIDNLETYYNRKEEKLYIESHEQFHEEDNTECYDEALTKKNIQQLMEYLEWQDWNIKIHYYDYDEAIICITHTKTPIQPHKNKLEMDFINHDLLQKIIPKRTPTQALKK